MRPWKGSAIAMGLLGAAIVGKLGWRVFRAESAGPPLVGVRVETKPLGAEIWLDGFPLGKITPATLHIDNALPHSLELRRSGWTRVRTTLQVGQPGDATLAFELHEAGALQVSSDPPGARVTIEGEPSGMTPCTVEIPAGSPTRVTASLEGYMPETSVATVASGETVPWRARLRAAGLLEISSEPPSLTAFVDGLPIGETPLSVSVEADAPHRVEVVLGKLRASTMATVAARATRNVALRIEDAEDENLRASLRAVASRLVRLRARIARLERVRPDQIGEALAATRKRELLEEEVDRLEQRQQEIDGEVGVHRTELEERAGELRRVDQEKKGSPRGLPF